MPTLYNYKLYIFNNETHRFEFKRKYNLLKDVAKFCNITIRTCENIIKGLSSKSGKKYKIVKEKRNKKNNTGSDSNDDKPKKKSKDGSDLYSNSDSDDDEPKNKSKDDSNSDDDESKKKSKDGSDSDSNSDSDDDEPKKKSKDGSDSDDDKTTLIDIYKGIYSYEGSSLTIIKESNNVLFKGKEIAQLLEYKNTKKALFDHVDDIDKITYEKIHEKLGNVLLPQISDKFNNPKTIFINQNGLFDLVIKSKMKKAKEFRNWISSKLLPQLFTTGTATLELQNLSKYDFYKDNLITSYENKHVVYLAYIGKYKNEDILKFGISNNYPRRELKEHRKTFNKYNVVYIEEVERNDEVEKRLKTEFKTRNALRSIKIEGKIRTELIAVNEIFNVNICISLIQQISMSVRSNSLSNIMALNNTIELLKTELTYKNELIKNNESRLKDKDEIIKLLKKQ